MVPFIEKCKLRCGFYGKQGAEGIHQELNIAANHTGINEPVMRLKSMLKRHHINTFPKAQNKELKPKIKARGPYKQKKLLLE